MQLTVIIISWNTRELLRDCLGSLHACATHCAFDIIVVDNASSDGSADMVESSFPNARLIRNAENVGFARANNEALELTRTEYALLLNSDTVVENPTLLGDWTDFMDRNTDVGASGCRLVWPGGRHQVGDAGYRLSLRSVVGYFWWLSIVAPKLFPPLYLAARRGTAPVDVDWVSGAACLVRTGILERTGLLDATIFMYAEDIEWCCRIRDAGFRVAYLPGLEVTHLQGASAKKQTKRGFSTMWLANLRALYFHDRPRQPRFVYDGVVALGIAVRIILRILLYPLRLLRGRDAPDTQRVGTLCRYLGFVLGGFGRRGP